MGSLWMRAVHGTPVMEEVADGKAFIEKEFTFYARLPNQDELLKASSKEHQEQWELKVDKSEENASKGSLRVRKTVEDGKEPYYVLTTKIPVPGTDDKIEVPVPTTIEQFEAFRYMSDRGMLKDRFFFPVDGSDLVWEVDMFIRPEGGYFEWCKIDLEVGDRGEQIPPFPIEFADIIMNQNGKRTPEEEQRVGALYQVEFLTKNVHKVGAPQAAEGLVTS